MGLVNMADELGRSPLHLAVEVGFEYGVMLLLQYGANADLGAPRDERVAVT